MRWMPRGRWTSRCSDPARETAAQATVEAAFLLPVFLLLVLLALQPVCLLYTRTVMEGAAAATARLAMTATAEDEAIEAFAIRRLAAVPDIAIFHVGGPLNWNIDCTRGAEGEGGGAVGITGYVRPLPVIGAFAHAFGSANAQGDIELAVSVSYRARPGWLEGDYATWISEWGA